MDCRPLKAMRILCFGDSNTYGYDPCSPLESRYPAQQRWVDILAGKLGCECINAGQNGREIPVREWELREFDRLLAENAPVDLLAILLGTNDLLQGNSVEAVTRRMENFLTHVHPVPLQILLISPPPMQRGAWVSTLELIEVSSSLRNGYKALSERFGVHFADAGMWDISLTYDGVHFTEEGHRAFAERLLSEMEIKVCWKLV